MMRKKVFIERKEPSAKVIYGKVIKVKWQPVELADAIEMLIRHLGLKYVDGEEPSLKK
jgi:hypothetical protein